MKKPKVQLKLRRGKYYARVRWSMDGTRHEKQVALKTSDESTAYLRLDVVREHSQSIASGNAYSFPWMNVDGKVKAKRFTITDAVKLYQESRTHLVRQSTLKRNKASLDRLIDVLGKRYPVLNLINSDIEKFKKFYTGNHKPGGININLRAIRTFLNWLLDEKYITDKIKVKLLKVGKPLPHYFNESELNAIMELNEVDDFYKDAFEFYLTTGCRKSEPFSGRIDGNWLIVDTNQSKTKNVRQISLNQRQLYLLKQMRLNHNQHLANGKQSYTHIDRYNKEFTKALKMINEDDTRSLHDLRHTYAVMLYLKTRDIYEVKGKLGHASVTMTELYTQFDIRRLEEDFPSIVVEKQARIIRFGDTESGDTIKESTSSSFVKSW